MDTVETVSDIDLFTFEGQAGDIVTIAVSDVADLSFGYQSVADLHSPTGVDLVSGAFAGQRDFTLPETGTYVIEVYDNGFNDVGVYRLELQCTSIGSRGLRHNRR